MFLFILIFSTTTLFKPLPVIYGVNSVAFETAAHICHLCGRTTRCKDLFLLSTICNCLAKKTLKQALKKSHDPNYLWKLNKNELSQIPTTSASDKKLISFLQQRYLYKFAGFDPFLVRYIYPCFGFNVDIHPETSNSYERDPSLRVSKKYAKVASTLSSLPLILTRPHDLTPYFPTYLKVKELEPSLERLAEMMKVEKLPIIVDLSSLNEGEIQKFYDLCEQKQLENEDIIAVQVIKKEELGAFALLDESKKKYSFLMNLIARSGLTANGIDLDRLPFEDEKKNPEILKIKAQTKENFLSFLENIKESPDHSKNLMLQTTLEILKGLVSRMTEEIHGTSYYLAMHSFEKIEKHLNELPYEGSFFDFANKLEKIHAEMSSLIEVFGPYQSSDFSTRYASSLKKIPEELKPLTSCTLHSSAMTSFAAIVKSVEKMVGKWPVILYGSNTYYECIDFSNSFANGTCLDQASQEEWEEADLLLTQFHPVLNLEEKVSYKLENVSEIIHKALLHGKKPLSVAVDITFEPIDSENVAALLEEFQTEILEGRLNICCFRSGSKFDLLGMDHYWGAPFFMIHNHDEKWKSFNDLITNPLLQTDRLSLNWFCLAYERASDLLEEYRKAIFQNGRLLLQQAPLLDPMDEKIRPAFVSMKIHGPLHHLRARIAICFLCIKCMEAGEPLFFRPSLGFYHANCGIIDSEDHSTIRLTLGPDPKPVALLARLLEILDGKV